MKSFGNLLSVSLVSVALAGCAENSPAPNPNAPASVPSGAHQEDATDRSVSEAVDSSGKMAAPSAPEFPQGQSEPEVDPAARVTIDQLAKAADPKEFNRKSVELTAKVARPGHFYFGSVALIVTADGALNVLGNSPVVTAIMAAEAEGTETLRTLSLRQDVTLAGELRMADTHVWELHNAVVVKVGEDPDVAVTATELTAAYFKDQTAAREKYGQASLKVSGKVAAKAVVFGQYAAVTLVGAPDAEGKPTTVTLQFRPDSFKTTDNRGLDQTALAEMLPYKEGDELEAHGSVQVDNPGTDPAGLPTIALSAYPTTWPLKSGTPE